MGFLGAGVRRDDEWMGVASGLGGREVGEVEERAVEQVATVPRA